MYKKAWSTCNLLFWLLNLLLFWRSRCPRRRPMMTRHYQDLGSDSDWSCRERNLLQPIRSTTQIWVVTRHQFLCSFLRRHFAGKPVVASQNVGFFFQAGTFLSWNRIFTFTYSLTDFQFFYRTKSVSFSTNPRNCFGGILIDWERVDLFLIFDLNHFQGGEVNSENFLLSF